MAMKNPQEEEKGYELGTDTMKRLEFYKGSPGKIGKEDVKGAAAAGMSEEQMLSEYNEYKDAGGRIGSGAQARMGDFQQIDSLQDFNADEISRGFNNEGNGPANDIRKIEMAMLLGDAERLGGTKNHGADGKGFSATEVNDLMKERGYTLSSGAQKLLNKHLAKVGSETRTDVTDPMDNETPVINTAPPMQVEEELKDLPVKDVADLIGAGGTMGGGNNNKITQSGSNISDNTLKTTIGNDNKFFGNFNSGIIDQGVTINSAGINGGAGGRDVAATNYGGALATNALLENLYQKQTTNFNPFATAQQAIELSEDRLGIGDRVANLDYNSRLVPLYNEAKAKVIEGNTLGDLAATQPVDWTQTANPEKYDTDFEKIADKYKI